MLEIGEILEGKVTGLTAFGAFVSLPDGKSGMVHISEVSTSFVKDIKEFLKVGQSVKVKVVGISPEGKISLSIKRAMEQPKRAPRERKAPPKPDNSFVWGAKPSEPASFEEMMSKFKVTSEEKFSDLKRKNPEARRTKRGAGIR
jgi:S1 RNA binding domain protein